MKKQPITISKIRELIESGIQYKEIAKIIGCHPSTISRISTGGVYRTEKPSLPGQWKEKVVGKCNFWISDGGLAWSCHYAKLLSGEFDEDGYLVFTLAGKKFKAHRLVAELFHGANPPNKPMVRHLDGNPKNNDASNLAWGDAIENWNDRRAHGRTHRHENNLH